MSRLMLNLKIEEPHAGVAKHDDHGAMAERHHLISKDAIDAIVIEVDEPIETLHLVLAHNAMLDNAGLHTKAVPSAFQAIFQQVSILHLLCVLG